MSATVWDLPENLRSKIRVDANSGCWLWIGARQSKGYGCGGGKAGAWLAHRRSYELLVSEIPADLTIDHLCRVKRCVNPAHLEPVTNAENIRRHGDVALATSFYPCGHPRTEGNTLTRKRPNSPRPLRNCRECNRAATRRWQAARKAAA